MLLINATTDPLCRSTSFPGPAAGSTSVPSRFLVCVRGDPIIIPIKRALAA
jgi:hypothetical protein